MTSRFAQLLMILTALMLSSCGYAKRAMLAGVMAVQSDAIMTQSSFDGQPVHLQNRCDDKRVTRFQFVETFSQAMTTPPPPSATLTRVRLACRSYPKSKSTVATSLVTRCSRTSSTFGFSTNAS